MLSPRLKTLGDLPLPKIHVLLGLANKSFLNQHAPFSHVPFGLLTQ